MENNKIDLALLEAIYISRWNETKTALQAVLTVEESEQIVDNIKFELSNVNHSIVDNDYISELELCRRMLFLFKEANLYGNKDRVVEITEAIFDYCYSYSNRNDEDSDKNRINASINKFKKILNEK